MKPPLEIYLLGVVPFDDLQRLQRRLVYDAGEGTDGGATLILCEHPPTITVGRSGSRAHIALDDDELRAQGIAVRWVNRGGGCVLHLPGQLAAYSIFPLAAAGFDLIRYLDALHQAVVGVLDEFDLRGSTRPDLSGVFLDNARVASVGVAVNRWIAYHGLTLNVATFLGAFAALDEPGLIMGEGGSAIGMTPGTIRQTSMESRRQRPAPMPKVREALIRQVEQVFDLERHHLYTHHPLIPREVRSHVHAPSLR